MLQKEKAYYFKVREGGKFVILSREQVLLKDPIALVEFYEKNMHVVPAKN